MGDDGLLVFLATPTVVPHGPDWHDDWFLRDWRFEIYGSIATRELAVSDIAIHIYERAFREVLMESEFFLRQDVLAGCLGEPPAPGVALKRRPEEETHNIRKSRISYGLL